MRRFLASLYLATTLVLGQTQVDLQRQARNVDFSNAATTRPVKTGTSLPATCSAGELFFNSAASAGVNLFGCVSTNVWALLGDGGGGGGGGGASLPSQTGNGTKVLTTDGTSAGWELLDTGSGLSKTQQTGTKVFSVDSAQIPFLALNNAFLGNNEFAGTLAATSGAPQTLTAVSQVLATTTHMRVGSATAIVLTSAPTIADGRDGQIGVIVNTGTNVITFRDEANLAGTNLCLVGDADVPLAPSSSLTLIFSGAAGCWVQIGGTGVGSGGGSGISSLGGQTGSTQTFVTGATGSDFAVSSAANIHTFNLPNAGPSARGVVTTGAQTLSGKKTFTPTSTDAGVNVGSLSSDPSATANGDIWYNTATGKFRCREGSSTKDCISSGGALPTQSGNANKVLTTDGTVTSWETLGASQGITITQQAGAKEIAVNASQVPLLGVSNTFTGDNQYGGKTIYTSGAEQALTAVDVVTTASTHVRVSAASTVTLTSTPTIADGSDGQTLVIVNTGANAITFQDEAIFAGTNLCMAGDANLALAGQSSLTMLFSSAAGCWVQTGGPSASSPGGSSGRAHGFYCGPGTSPVTASGTAWCGLGFTASGATVSPRTEIPAPLDSGESCTVSNLRVRTSGSSAALNLSGGTLRVDVAINGTAAAVTCTVADGTSSCSDTSNTATVSAGDYVTFKLTSGAYSTAPYVQASFDCRQ